MLTTWLALSAAATVGGALLGRWPAFLGPFLAAFAIAVLLGFDPLPGPLRRDAIPMSLPVLRAVARRRGLNPFYVVRIVMKSPFRPDACKHELRTAVGGWRWLPQRGRLAFTGRFTGGTALLRRTTWWANGARPTAHLAFADARPGTEITVQVAAPALASWVAATFALFALAMGLIAGVGGVAALVSRGAWATALVAVAVGAAVLTGASALFVLLARLRIPGTRDVSEADRVVAFLSDVLAAEVISRE